MESGRNMDDDSISRLDLRAESTLLKGRSFIDFYLSAVLQSLRFEDLNPGGPYAGMHRHFAQEK